MVYDLGVPTESVGGWNYVDTTGDPYSSASRNQRDYAQTYLLKNPRSILYNQLPTDAAIILAFLRCESCCIQDVSDATAVELPGSRSMLCLNRAVVGYNDLVGRVLYIPHDTSKLSGKWKYLLSKLWRACSITTSNTVTRIEDDEIWLRLLINWMQDVDIVDLNEDLQSRLQWELRVRLRT